VDPNDYTLTFNDEFDSFNPSNWNDAIWYESSSPTINYTNEGGALKIWPQKDGSGNFVNRTIDTDKKFSQTYGFFEMEAQLPIGKGVWPAFWLLNHTGSARPEIDIMEAYPGGGPAGGWGDSNLHPVAYQATVHDGSPVGSKTLRAADLSASFHKYGMRWEPNKLTFYFDGAEIFKQTVSFSAPMYILLDLWFGSASGTPDGTTPQGKGNSYIINYVRAWQFK
jgi:beta-glucanase (GH16 family)